MVLDDVTARSAKYESKNVMQKNEHNTEIDCSRTTFPNASWLI